MPVTYNAPNAWDFLIDNVLNQSERTPQSNGSYTFGNTNAPVKQYGDATGTPREAFYPDPSIRKYGQERFHETVRQRAMREVEQGDIPYNVKQIESEKRSPDDFLLEALQQWLSRNMSSK